MTTKDHWVSFVQIIKTIGWICQWFIGTPLDPYQKHSVTLLLTSMLLTIILVLGGIVVGYVGIISVMGFL